jgi:hypothetical protein
MTIGSTSTGNVAITSGVADATITATSSTGTLNITSGNLTGNALAVVTGTGNVTVSGGDAGDTVTVTGLATTGQTFTGSAASIFKVTAGAGAQTITTGVAADIINGGAGADILTGGATGVDTFRYETKANITGASGVNVDTITDFTTTVDKINFGITGNGAGATILGLTLVPATTTANTIAAPIAIATSVATIADVYTALTANVTASGGLHAAGFLASTAAAADATVGVWAKLVTFANGAAAGQYLIVNDSTAGFLEANDTVIKVVGTVVAADLTFTS